MSNFTSDVEFISTNEYNRNRRIFVLNRELLWELNYVGSGRFISVEKGFRTDFLSIPSFIFILNYDGKYAAAGALHDKLYRTVSDRKFADDQLHDAMTALGASKLLANTIWLAVRCFGWRFFGRENF